MSSIVPWITVIVLFVVFYILYHFGGVKLALPIGGLVLYIGSTFLPSIFLASLINLSIVQITVFTVALGVLCSLFVASFTRTSERLDATIGSFWSRMFLVLLAFVAGCAIQMMIPGWWQKAVTVSPFNSTVKSVFLM